MTSITDSIIRLAGDSVWDTTFIPGWNYTRNCVDTSVWVSVKRSAADPVWDSVGNFVKIYLDLKLKHYDFIN